MKTTLDSLRGRLIGAVALLGLVFTVMADRPWLVAESTYLGDGWFRYRVGSRWSPLINTITIGTVGGYPATSDWIEMGTIAPGWTFTNQYWAADDWYSPWQSQPYDAVFEARSPLTNYCRGTNILLMSLTMFELQNLAPVVSANAVGYWIFPAHIPCLPEQADSSPVSLYSELTYADVVISQLIKSDQGITGLQFYYDDYATYLLEASRDMLNWLKVAYLYGQPGMTTWTTNVDLGQWGNYFRLGYVGFGQIPFTNLPPLGQPLSPDVRRTSPAPKPAAAPSVSAVPGTITVHLPAVTGKRYEVTVYSRGNAVWSTSCVASGSQVSVALPATILPPTGVIQTKEIP
jgi:hypothetical protein